MPPLRAGASMPCESVCGDGFEVVDITTERRRSSVAIARGFPSSRSTGSSGAATSSTRTSSGASSERVRADSRRSEHASRNGSRSCPSVGRLAAAAAACCGDRARARRGASPERVKRLGPTFVRLPSFAIRFKAIRICSTLTVSPRSANASTTRAGVIGSSQRARDGEDPRRAGFPGTVRRAPGRARPRQRRRRCRRLPRGPRASIACSTSRSSLSDWASTLCASAMRFSSCRLRSASTSSGWSDRIAESIPPLVTRPHVTRGSRS